MQVRLSSICVGWIPIILHSALAKSYANGHQHGTINRPSGVRGGSRKKVATTKERFVLVCVIEFTAEIKHCSVNHIHAKFSKGCLEELLEESEPEWAGSPLWGSKRAKLQSAPSGITHMGPLWVSPLRADCSFAFLGPHEGFLWATHCGLVHRKPTWTTLWVSPCRACCSFAPWGPSERFLWATYSKLLIENPHRSPCGLAHVGPTAFLPFWTPMRVFWGQLWGDWFIVIVF